MYRIVTGASYAGVLFAGARASTNWKIVGVMYCKFTVENTPLPKVPFPTQPQSNPNPDIQPTVEHIPNYPFVLHPGSHQDTGAFACGVARK